MVKSPVNPALLAKAIAGMKKESTVGMFCATTGIASKSVAKTLLKFLLARGIGKTEGNIFIFSGRDRVEAAILAIHAGCDPEQVSGDLSWKDFEGLASHILSSLGYRTRTNVRFVKPRMEIDVVGVDHDFAIAIDCKHWKNGNASSISTYCAKQVARVKELVKREVSITHAVPAVLTLHTEHLMYAGGVPIVPVARFGSFLADMRGFLPDMCVITRQGSAWQ